ncbi:hypothetical protein [Actinoplanes sp. NPDC051859]|uniref:hypothetical protein n=1 Tax=Actinoplanes sp. NPDC051859 TaxID=3363909 RepID=UPI0037B78F4B
MNQRESFDPILSESPMSVFDLPGASGRSSGHTALVFLPDVAARVPTGVLIDEVPTFMQRLQRRFWRYEVDLAHRTTWVTLDLPAAEEAFSFTAKVCFTWTVADPAAVVRFGIRDTKAIIWRYLDQLLRGVSRQYGIEDSGPAEEEMNRRLQKEPGDLDYGLRLSMITVNLHLDAAAQQHLASRVESRRATELARDEHELHVLREQHTLAEARMRGQLERAQAQHERDMESVRSRHLAELELANAKHSRIVDELLTSKDLALKKQRLTFYRNALEGNSSDVLVLQLIEHPEDIGAVVEMLNSGTEISYDRSRKIMQDLLQQEMVHAADVESLRQNVVEQLSSALNVRAPQGGIKIDTGGATRVAMRDGDKMVIAEAADGASLSAS